MFAATIMRRRAVVWRDGVTLAELAQRAPRAPARASYRHDIVAASLRRTRVAVRVGAHGVPGGLHLFAGCCGSAAPRARQRGARCVRRRIPLLCARSIEL